MKRKMKNKIQELIVRPRFSSRRRLFIVGLGLLAFLATAFAVYKHGLSMAGFDRSAYSENERRLIDRIASLRSENQALRESLARAQLAVEMHRTSYDALNRTLKSSAKDMLKLREELDFYRNIISPANKVGGLKIQRLDISRAAGSRQYRYKLVLIQALKHDRNVGGQVRFELNGDRTGEPLRLLFPQGERRISVNFKYFQDVEGSWRLPVDFKPKAITVHVSTAGGGVEQTFPWPGAG